MPNKYKSCTNIKKLLSVEMEIIRRHIDNHKWFNKISDKNEGVCDFVFKYGWLIQELYCGFSCPKRHKCECAERFLIENEDNE